MKYLKLLTFLAMSALGTLQSLSATAQTSSITREAYEDNLLRKSFGKLGVGIVYTWIKQVDTGGFTITQVAPDSPAFNAGLKVDDQIVAVDNKIIIGMDDVVASKRLVADNGSPKKLTYVRGGIHKDVELNHENGVLGLGFINANPSYYARIDQVLKGLPAQRSGLMEGDLLLGVDFQSLKTIGSSEKLQEYLSQGSIGSLVTLAISRHGEVFQIRMLRAIVPNVEADFGAKTFAKRSQTSSFARREWSELSLWNMDWQDLLNPDLKNFQGKKYNALDEALARLQYDKYVVWNLTNNIWANDPEQTARIAARFMKVDGWVLSYKNDSTGALTTYRRVGSVLSKEVTIGAKTETSVVENDLGFFSPKLVLLVNEKTASGAVALAYALRKSGSAMVVGQQPFGSTRITHFENPKPNVYQKVEVGSYTMENGGGVPANVDVVIDKLSATNSSTAFDLLVKPDLQWWEDQERLSAILYNVIGGTLIFTFLSIVTVLSPKTTGFPGVKLRNAAKLFVALEVMTVALVAVIAMLAQMFWPTLVIIALALGIWVGRSRSRTTSAT